jgi:hypothetical protein
VGGARRPAKNARALLRSMPHATMPEVPLSWSPEQLAAQVVHCETAASHAGIIEGGAVLPTMLKRSRLPMVLACPSG